MVRKAAIAASLLWVVSVLVLTPGCFLAAAGAAAGGVFYAKGDLESTMEAKPPAIAAATEKAFAEMGIAKRSAASSAVDAEITGRTARDKKVTVKVKAETANFSKVSIRVGTFGDEDLSRLIFDKIRKNL